MTFIIELSPEIEAGLTALAAAHGLALPQYVRQVLEGQVPGHTAPKLSAVQRMAVWRDVKNLPICPPLSDAAISRDTLYDTRG